MEEPTMMFEYIRVALCEILVERAREKIAENPDYKHLLKPVPLWKKREFNILADMTELSVSSVKRLFFVTGHTPTQLQPKQVEKILAFLNCTQAELELRLQGKHLAQSIDNLYGAVAKLTADVSKLSSTLKEKN